MKNKYLDFAHWLAVMAVSPFIIAGYFALEVVCFFWKGKF